MKTLIQQAGDYTLHVELDRVEVSDGVRIKFVSYFDSTRQNEQPSTKLDLHMSKSEFAVMCRAMNVFALED